MLVPYKGPVYIIPYRVMVALALVVVVLQFSVLFVDDGQRGERCMGDSIPDWPALSQY